MNRFWLNVFLALAWTALQGEVTLANLLVGLVLGGFALALADIDREHGYAHRTRAFASFILYYVRELAVSNARVAHEVLTPSTRSTPAVIAVPLKEHGDVRLFALASLVTITPGTLALDLSPDGRTLYVHAMFVNDPDDVRRELTEGLERRLMEVFP